MQTVKRFVRGKKHYIQQVVHRISEIEEASCSITYGRLRRPSKKGLLWNNFYVSTTEGDNCFRIKNNKIITVLDIEREEGGVNEQDKMQVIR